MLLMKGYVRPSLQTYSEENRIIFLISLGKDKNPGLCTPCSVHNRTLTATEGFHGNKS